MKCTLKAKCSKDVFLKHTFYSVEAKHKDGFTYGFYHAKKFAAEDRDVLSKAGVPSDIISGWEVDGFVVLKSEKVNN